tara:strand:- start:3180 stop:4100 length:921 start_codon:yes stop_codon:yes gene_type:complete
MNIHKKKLKVTICIPFYTWNGDKDRTKITEKIFKHYKNLQITYKDTIDISFVFIGSENKLSKELVEKYFTNSYHEFKQENIGELIDKKGKTRVDALCPRADINIFKVLTAKIKYGINLARKNDYDILLVAGSNDYIDPLFFRNLLSKYKIDIPQIYGVSNAKNGNNICCVLPYSYDEDLTISNDTPMWNGYNNIHDHEYNRNSIYLGGIIGFNRFLNDKYTKYVDNVNASECDFEDSCRKEIPNLMIITTEKLVSLNIKSNSGADLTHMELVNQFIEQGADICKLHELSEDMKQKILTAIKYFNDL